MLLICLLLWLLFPFIPKNNTFSVVEQIPVILTFSLHTGSGYADSTVIGALMGRLCVCNIDKPQGTWKILFLLNQNISI